MKRYLVTVDATKCTGEYEEEYGTSIGLIGVFDSLAEAIAAKESTEKKWPMLEKEDPDDEDDFGLLAAIAIHEIDSNFVYGLHLGGCANTRVLPDFYIGGYSK